MTVAELRRLLLAPELVVVNLLDESLTALRLALLTEHPLADDRRAADEEEAPVQRRARAVLRRALRLRRALAAYRREVDLALGLEHDPDDDMPF